MRFPIQFTVHQSFPWQDWALPFQWCFCRILSKHFSPALVQPWILLLNGITAWLWFGFWGFSKILHRKKASRSALLPADPQGQALVSALGQGSGVGAAHTRSWNFSHRTLPLEKINKILEKQQIIQQQQWLQRQEEGTGMPLTCPMSHFPKHCCCTYLGSAAPLPAKAQS